MRQTVRPAGAFEARSRARAPTTRAYSFRRKAVLDTGLRPQAGLPVGESHVFSGTAARARSPSAPAVKQRCRARSAREAGAHPETQTPIQSVRCRDRM